MMLVAKFTFNPFQENTYVLYDDTKECIIIDPGCYTSAEQQVLVDFIEATGLKPVRLLNTHCHIDHVFGNQFVAKTWDLGLEIHEGELPVLMSVPQVSQLYGIPLPDESPMPTSYIKEGQEINFGNTSLRTLFTPGHSPASISFYNEADKILIAGDVLFRDSIGRTDLPGGNFDTLINSIKTQFYPLGDEVKVFSGHGEDTTIGYEKRNNVFLQEGFRM